MIDTHRMTKEEAEECMHHFLLHDMADLCISQGIEPTLEELINLINSKLDNLEPV